jgi:bacterioferritin (cytochrome b1)
METAKEELIPATKLQQILAVNLKEEAKAINHYKSILSMIDRSEDILLFETIEDITEDEQEHREELSRLQE